MIYKYRIRIKDIQFLQNLSTFVYTEYLGNFRRQEHGSNSMTLLKRKLEESTSGMRSSIVRSITNIDNMNETCEQLSSMTDEDISELYNIMMYAVYTYARELINQSKICGSIRTRINNNPLSYGGINVYLHTKYISQMLWNPIESRLTDEWYGELVSPYSLKLKSEFKGVFSWK